MRDGEAKSKKYKIVVWEKGRQREGEREGEKLL